MVSKMNSGVKISPPLLKERRYCCGWVFKI